MAETPFFFDDHVRLRSRLASSLSTPTPPLIPTELVEDIHLTFKELQAAHEEVGRERQRYQELFEFAPDGHLITDLDGTIREANHAAVQLFEVDAPALIGKPLAVFVAKEHKNIFRSRLARLRGTAEDTPRDWDMTMIPRSNGPIPVSIRVALCRKDGARDTLRWLIRDVTARKAAQDALWEKTEAFVALLEISPSAIITLDKRGHVTMWNLAAERLLGWAGWEMLGKPLRLTQLTEDGTRAFHLWQEVQQPGWSSQAMDLQLKTRSGSAIDVSMSVGSLLDKDGQAQGCIAIFVDLTDRKRAEAIERESQDKLRQLLQRLELIREEERNRIARELHDELGQALTALKFDLAGLTRDLDASRQPKALRKAHAMEEQISTLMHVVRRVSTELRPPILDDLGLQAVIEWQSGEFSKRTRICCEVHSAFEENLPSETCTVILRIYQEILTNVARHAQASHVTTRFKRVGSNLVLSVTDDGVGLTPAQWNDPTALGLLGMRERATLIGATIHLEPTQAGGTTIVLSLPV